MNLEFWIEIFNSDFWMNLALQFKDLGPIAPIFLVVLESLLPFMPLMLIIALNTGIYGVFYGYLYSFIGSVVGSLIVFFFFRFFKNKKFIAYFVQGKRVSKILHWVLMQHPVFVTSIIASPLTPSSFINISFGLSGYSKRLYTMSLIVGKAILMTYLVWLGNSINSIQDQPHLILVSLAIFALVYYLSHRFGHLTGIEKLKA